MTKHVPYTLCTHIKRIYWTTTMYEIHRHNKHIPDGKPDLRQLHLGLLSVATTFTTWGPKACRIMIYIIDLRHRWLKTGCLGLERETLLDSYSSCTYQLVSLHLSTDTLHSAWTVRHDYSVRIWSLSLLMTYPRHPDTNIRSHADCSKHSAIQHLHLSETPLWTLVLTALSV
jgi:hypothetical protein